MISPFPFTNIDCLTIDPEAFANGDLTVNNAIYFLLMELHNFLFNFASFRFGNFFHNIFSVLLLLLHHFSANLQRRKYVNISINKRRNSITKTTEKIAKTVHDEADVNCSLFVIENCCEGCHFQSVY